MLHQFRKLYAFLRTQIRKYYNGNKFLIRTKNSSFCINTTYGHPLKSYLRSTVLHDRFLPCLVKNTGSGLIDVGSNIGDTLVLVKSQIDCKVVCIEPDIQFNTIIDKNIKENNLTSVLRYPFALSAEKRIVQTQKNYLSSSSNIVSSKVGSCTKSIDDLITDLNLDLKEYKTIKIDTDGYDWDVLESINNYCQNNSTTFDFIFYEHQTFLNNLGPSDPDRIWRENKYYSCLCKLRDFKYTNYYIFDNYGNFILNTPDLECLRQVVRYPRNCIGNKLVFDFCDVLLCKSEHIDIVEKALSEYSIRNFEVLSPNKLVPFRFSQSYTL